MIALITAAVGLLSDLVKGLVDAGDDKDKQEATLMAAEEKLAQMRAKAKFG